MANPASLIGSAAMLLAGLRRTLERAGGGAAAALMEAALDRVIAVLGYRTRDLGGELGIRAFTAKVMTPLTVLGLSLFRPDLFAITFRRARNLLKLIF